MTAAGRTRFPGETLVFRGNIPTGRTGAVYAFSSMGVHFAHANRILMPFALRIGLIWRPVCVYWKQRTQQERIYTMEFRQLEAFKLVVESGNFSETAKQMGLTQPSVSTQISALEHEFGCQLLERHPGNTVPTETGQALYRYAVDMLAMRDKAIASCGRHREMGGTISIAASSIPYQFVLPVLTARFSLKYPDAKFNLMGADSARAADKVLAGEADLGMVGTVLPNKALEYEPILEDELVVVTPALAPYTGWNEGPVEVADLIGIPFVAREAGSGTWSEVEAYLAQQGYDSGALNVVAYMDNPDAIVKAVAQGLGVTILSSLAANEYARNGDIRVFSLAHSPAKRKIYIVWATGKKLPTVAQAFVRSVSARDELD